MVKINPDTMETLANVIERSTANGYRMGREDTLQELGFSAGEVSERKGMMLYGMWFREAVANGSIKPSRIGNGVRANRYYSTKEILAYRAKAEIRAQII